MGRNGKKNWLVTGMSRAATRSVTAAIFRKGPGDGLIDNANMPRVTRSKYWAS